MRVLNATTQGEWLGILPPLPPAPAGSPTPALIDRAKAEAQRALSELFHCDHLIILAGLGTSMGVASAFGDGPTAPSMWDLWQRVEAQMDAQSSRLGFNFQSLLSFIGHSAADTNIEALLSRCRLAQAFYTGDDNTRITRFVDLAEREIVDATRFVSIDHPLPTHQQFLRRIARRSQRKQRAKLFTTNYDKCFEEAARQARLIVNDGFSTSIPSTFDAMNFMYDQVSRAADGELQEFVPNLFHLYKVHGSVDWELDPVTREVRKVPDPARPLLIYPRNTKYELAFEPPYLEMIAAFQASLRQPNVGLLIVGFGFNDNHVAEPILSAVRSNLGLKLVVVGPRLAPTISADGTHVGGEVVSNVHLRTLSDLAKAGDARIALINQTFDGLLQYVPDLAAESDREKHVARLRNLGQLT